MSELEKMGAIVEKDPKMPKVISYALKNGLKILILEKHFSPIISFNMTFKAGNVDNEQGKTGLAHMAEHMAFKGTKTINALNYKKEKVVLEKIEKANEILTLEKGKKNRNEEKIKQLEIDFKKLLKEADEYIIKNEYIKIYKELGST